MMHKHVEEEEILWTRFREGDDRAFYRLYDLYVDNLYKYGSNFSRDKDLIKDCIQDLFLNLYKYRKRISATDNIQFYLYRSLRRIIHKELNKLIPLHHDDRIISLRDSQDISYEDCLIVAETEEEDRRKLYSALNKLSDRQREALSLKFEQDLPYSEIAVIMDISVESARTIIYRSIKEIRKCVEKKGLVQLMFLFSKTKR